MSQTYRTNYAEIDWSDTPQWTPTRKERDNLAPYVILDTMPATLHMATGRMSESKSEFRKWTRQAGCEEVGNSKFPERKPAEMPRAGADIKRAIEKLRSGNA